MIESFVEVESSAESVVETTRENAEEKLLAIEDDFNSDDDESLMERLLGLSEMFPEKLRSGVYHTAKACTAGVKGFYAFSRSASWILFASTTLLFAPVLFEVERMQVVNAQLNQQKQVLLGPNSVLSSGSSLGSGMSMMPPH